jgi:hypothetical protein
VCPQALLRASLAAARLHHGFLTTPHLLLGIISAGSASLAAAPAAAGSSSSSNSLAAAAEAAVVALIDGPGAGQGDRAVVAGAGAAASMLGQSCGLDVVQWVPQLSGPAKTLLLQAEDFRKHQGSRWQRALVRAGGGGVCWIGSSGCRNYLASKLPSRSRPLRARAAC